MAKKPTQPKPVESPEPVITHNHFVNFFKGVTVYEVARFALYVAPALVACWYWIKPLAAQQVKDMMDQAGISVPAFKQTQSDIAALQSDLEKVRSDLEALNKLSTTITKNQAEMKGSVEEVTSSTDEIQKQQRAMLLLQQELLRLLERPAQ